MYLPAGRYFAENIPESHNAFIYVINGPVTVDGKDNKSLSRDELAVLSEGNQLQVFASDKDARFLLIAGKPLNEPVARGGPFVMNTRDEIDQAFDDYRAGRF